MSCAFVRIHEASRPDRPKCLRYLLPFGPFTFEHLPHERVHARPGAALAVAGLRGMFRQAGAITAVSVTAAIVARSADPGITQAHVFLVFAALMAGALPLMLPVPEHRGRW